MSADHLFPTPETPSVEILGTSLRFPVRRIFCVGRNYAAHAAEMGNEVDREAPFYFTKSAHALCPSGQAIPFPPGTQDCHYEMEFVAALGAPGFEVTAEEAPALIFGYACGIDLTRRDLQAAAKEKRRPWDLGKDFENSAILAPITRATEIADIGPQRIRLYHNDALVQDALLSDMIWSLPDIVAHLSRFYHLSPGDLIYTGTPAGVGPVRPGSVLKGEIDGLSSVHLELS